MTPAEVASSTDNDARAVKLSSAGKFRFRVPPMIKCPRCGLAARAELEKQGG